MGSAFVDSSTYLASTHLQPSERQHHRLQDPLSLAFSLDLPLSLLLPLSLALALALSVLPHPHAVTAQWGAVWRVR
jgi:hypothetical protein